MQNVVFERIQKEIDGNDVVLFMKGDAAFPQCGFFIIGGSSAIAAWRSV